ncbi:glutamate--ammonia ligase catalytic domain protein [Perkinsela sp. CCAP 1560/4]|nr:glutamate--ammonia ligase catalytic domain protein [Perkinsela sp. CCAP 1560/4]|eukprot:KNH05650.1 glutamate--ammonia ligase catalytic domain protein [Perkinsela sp. CCAP 1560/4]
MNLDILYHNWIAAEAFLENGELLLAIRLLHGMLSLSPDQIHSIDDSIRNPGARRLKTLSWPTALARYELYTRLRIAAILVEYTMNFEDAKSVLTPALALFWSADVNVYDKARVYRMLGKIYLHKRKPGGALEMYEKAIELISRDAKQGSTETAGSRFLASLLIEYYAIFIPSCVEKVSSVASANHSKYANQQRTRAMLTKNLKIFRESHYANDYGQILCALQVIEALMDGNLSNAELHSEGLGALLDRKSDATHSDPPDDGDMLLSDAFHQKGTPTSSLLLSLGTLRLLVDCLVDAKSVPCKGISLSPEYGRLVGAPAFCNNLLILAAITEYRYRNGLTAGFEQFGDALKKVYASTRTGQETSDNFTIPRKHFDHVLYRVVDKYLLEIDERIRTFVALQKTQGKRLHLRNIEELTFFIGSKIFLNTQVALLEIRQLSFKRALRRVYLLCKTIQSYPSESLRGAEEHRGNLLVVRAVLANAVGKTNLAVKSLRRLDVLGRDAGDENRRAISFLNLFHQPTGKDIFQDSPMGAWTARFGDDFIENSTESVIATEGPNEQVVENNRHVRIAPSKVLEFFDGSRHIYASNSSIETAYKALDEAHVIGDKLLQFRLLGWLLSREIDNPTMHFNHTQNKEDYVRLIDEHESALISVGCQTNHTLGERPTDAQIRKEWQVIEEFE